MSNINNWKATIGGWGFILWFATFQLADFLKDTEYGSFLYLNSGYMIGFITTFSALIFWDIVDKKWSHIFGNEGTLDKVLSVIPVLVLLIVGFFGFMGTIVGGTPWQYNVGFALGSIVLQQGTYPLIMMLDGSL